MSYKELLGYSGLFNIIYGGISFVFGNNPIEPIAIILGGVINVLLFIIIYMCSRGVSK